MGQTYRKDKCGWRGQNELHREGASDAGASGVSRTDRWQGHSICQAPGQAHGIFRQQAAPEKWNG